MHAKKVHLDWKGANKGKSNPGTLKADKAEGIAA
jgi:hypothetical protein